MVTLNSAVVAATLLVLVLAWSPAATAHRFIGATYTNRKGNVYNAYDIVDFDQRYYYANIYTKMAESLSVSNCTMGGGIKDWHGYGPPNGHDADVEVHMHPPGKTVLQQWQSLKYSLSETPTKHATRRQFVRVSPSLCVSKEFKFYSAGHFRSAKGCLKMIQKDKNTGRETKVVNTYGATLHPDHSRCNHMAAVQACKTSTKQATDYPIEIENETPIANEAYPFLVTAKDVIVARSGMFSLPCGPFGLYSSCEATNWGLPVARNHTADAAKCRHADDTHGEHMTEGGHGGRHAHALSLEDCPHPVYDKVFAMCQYDDTQIGQFVLEALPKLVYHLDMLYANPDMKIHYGFTKKAVLPSFVLPHTIFQWLGLSDRLINGTYYAKEAYMPREGGCQEPGYNMWELYHMRETFKNIAKKEIGTGGRNNSGGWGFPSSEATTVDGGEADLGPMDFQSNAGDSDKPVVILVKRGASKFTQNQGDFKIRRWPPKLGGAGAVRAACGCTSRCPVFVALSFSDARTR